MPQGLDGVQMSRLARRPERKEKIQYYRSGERERRCSAVEDKNQPGRIADDSRDWPGQHKAQQDSREGHRCALDRYLKEDVNFCCSKCSACSDFARALSHGNPGNAEHSEAGDRQRAGSNPAQEEPETVCGGCLGVEESFLALNLKVVSLSG